MKNIHGLQKIMGRMRERRFGNSGALKISRFISKADTREMHKIVDDIYTLLSSCREFPDEDFLLHYNSANNVWLNCLPAYLETYSAGLVPKYAWLTGLITARISEFFGKEWHYLQRRSFFRRQIGTKTQISWHVDADAAATYGSGEHCINVWMPLDPVGQKLPSLDIVRGSHSHMCKLPLLEGEHRNRDDDFVSRIGQASTPRLNPGDALIFDQFMLHRTQRIGNAETVRTSCEFRFAC